MQIRGDPFTFCFACLPCSQVSAPVGLQRALALLLLSEDDGLLQSERQTASTGCCCCCCCCARTMRQLDGRWALPMEQ